jgi:thioredoxin 1
MTNNIKWTVVFVICAFSALTFCRKQDEGETGLKDIETFAGMNMAIDSAKSTLIAFDLYADWCMPCRMLSPTLDAVAKEKIGQITIYRINVDRVPEAAQFFKVNGIPHVVFMKNNATVGTLIGVHSKEEYLKIIDSFSGNPQDTVLPKSAG